MLFVFEGMAPAAQNYILLSINKDQNDIQFIETETEFCTNNGAVAETI